MSETENQALAGTAETEREEGTVQNADNTAEKSTGDTAGAFFKRFLKRYFIDAFSGMALGLFCTLIAGTIVSQIGALIGNNAVGKIITGAGDFAKSIMGAGIGVGIAHSLGSKKLTMFSAAAAGIIGSKVTIIFFSAGINIPFMSAGLTDPVAAYIAAVFAIEVARMVEGKTPVDIIVIPLLVIAVGLASAIVLGIPFGILFSLIGRGLAMAILWEPISFGILIAVVMGLLLTLPTSSAAVGLMLFNAASQDPNLAAGAGLAAAAACAGCCAHMVGFAVASFRENRWGGLISQGLGTSMLQIPNLAVNLRILIPAIVASAVAGPLASAAFSLQCNAIGSGMGTSGLVGVLQTIFVSIDAGLPAWQIGVGVAVCYFLVPALVAFAVSELMRKKNWIKPGDMKI